MAHISFFCKKSENFIKNEKIIEFFKEKGYSGNMNNLGRILTSEGYEKGKVNNKRGWFISLLETNEVIKDAFIVKQKLKLPDTTICTYSNLLKLNQKIRRLLKDKDSHIIHKKTLFNHDIILSWKSESYEMDISELETIVSAFSIKI